MAKLKLDGLSEDKPVKVTVELSGSIHRNLIAYATVLAAETRQAPLPPEKLIAPMLERFMATDRAFAKAQRQVISKDNA
ncbi:TPA: DUF2274 domain-containing protein [Stenotrophomonas maltophilia]|jgi:hypothetical protein|uniref:DUF2274 domain-containing protein n=1 Tax=Pseudomonadota TaxID=1224 RepID=UPI0010F58F33|nr:MULTISPECIES: DUF2274 domain-containing protein [Pseudomonadota]MCU4554640.1 DUF2274 domain-containing protein [Acinetobacter nosocomialis]